MFAVKQTKEIVIRALLIAVILFNAVLPTAALAKSEKNPTTGVTNNASLNAPRSLPEQEPLYFDPSHITYPQQTSPEPDKPQSPIPSKDEVEFTLVADPAIVPANGLVKFSVFIRNNSDRELAGLVFADNLENGLSYSQDNNSPVVFDQKTNKVSLEIDPLNPGDEYTFSYSVILTSTKKNAVKGKIWLHGAELKTIDNLINLKADVALGFDLQSMTSESELAVLQSNGGWNRLGRVAIHMEKDSVEANALVVSSPAKVSGKGPELQFNLDVIETNPVTVDSKGKYNEQAISVKKENKNPFKEPAFLEINLDDYIDLKNIPAGQEPYVATYDEINKIWVKVPIIAQDYEDNTVTVEAAHFSTWGAGLGSSLPQNGANVLLFDQPYTSLFTGSSRYSIPIWTPPGRAGMQPDVSLSYSSGTVDGVLGDVQAPWVGVGWNIDAVEIVRKITTDENGYGYRNDFALTLNGSLYQLIRDENSQNRYYTDQAAFLYVERHNYAFNNNPSTANKTGEWWEVVTTDGTRYRLGWNEKSEQLALMYGYSCTTNGLSCITPNGAYASLGYAGKAKDLVAMRWRVDRVSDTHGNYIEYDYMETQPSDATTIALFDRESYLQSISYTGFEDPDVTDGITSPIEPAYEIKFNAPSRTMVGDVPTEFTIWDNIDSKLLNNIQICYGTCGATGGTTIRTYQFNYTLADVPNANGTLTLTSLEITGGGYTEDGQAIPVTEAPTIKFTYQNKDNRASGNGKVFTYPRLATIRNGSGGKLTFTYGDDERANNSWYNYRVENVDVDGGMGIVKRQSYAYDEPVYSGLGGNPDLGSLIGYTTVTESVLDFNNADAKILDTKHTFGTVGLDIGRELQTQLLIGGTTTVLRKTTNIYVTDNSQAPFAGWNYRYLGESANYVRSGSALTLTSKTSYYHDPATGNLLVQSNYLGNSLYRKTYYEYLTNLDPAYYILDKVSRVLLVNAGNQIYSDTRYHYDDTLNEAPTRGDVTLVQKLTGNSSETVDVSTHYDVYGNADWTRAYKSYGSVNNSPSSAYVESVSTYDETLRTYPISAADAMGNISTSYYLYTLGVPYQTTDPNEWTTTSTYDGLGRTLSVTPPGLDQAGTVYIYPTPNGNGNIPAPHSVEMQILDTIAGKYRSVWGIYDGAGRMLQTQVDASISPIQDKLLVNTTLFNAQGLAQQQSLPYEVDGAGGNYSYNVGSKFTTMEYDALGRVIKVTAPGNIISQTSYDGLITTSLDPNGNKVSRTTDGFGRMTAVAEFSDDDTVYATTNYFYDAADRLVQVKDAQFNTTVIQYDWLGRKLEMDDPDMGVWSYNYDSLGNMISQTDARGEQLLFNYDDLNRLILKQDDDPNTQDITSYTYGTQSGEIGLRVGMSDPSGSTTWDYGDFARMVTESRIIGGVPQELTTRTDWLGRAIYTSYEDGEVISYAYDDLGRPKTLISDQATLVDLAYNTLGQISTQTLGNATVITNVYNNSTTRLNRRIAVNGGTLFDLSYQYDLNGNITRLTDNQLGETHFYQYDFLNRLTSAVAGNGILTAPPATPQAYGQQYEYDKVGNILQVNEWGSPSTPQAYQSSPGQFQPVSYDVPAPVVTPLQQSGIPAKPILDDSGRGVFSSSQTPFGGTAWTVPGTIQAEDFDEGGEGIAYHDLTTANEGGAYRTNEGVDIETTSDAGGGYNLSLIGTDEWTKYTVNVTTTGTYSLNLRLATPHNGPYMHVEVDGVNVTGSIATTNTGDFQNWATVTVPGIYLTAGQHVVKLAFGTGSFNINYFTFNLNTPTATKTATATADATPTSGATYFPSAPVLDDFNRANGLIGSSWNGFTGAYTIASNQLDIVTGGWDNHIYWKNGNVPFGADQEAYVTLSQIDPSTGSIHELMLKSQSNTTYGNGALYVDRTGNNTVEIITYDSTNGWVTQGAEIPVTFVNGDQLGARAKANGDVEVYKNGVLVGTRNVNSWPYYDKGGYIGMWMAFAVNTVLDDFGGGTVSSSSTVTPTLTQTSPLATSTFTKTNTPSAATNTPTKTYTPAPATSSFTPSVTLTPSVTASSTSTITPSATATRTLVPTNTPPGTYTPTITPPPFYVAKNWLFNSTTESWAVTNHISGFAWQTGGYVGGTITGTDPHIVSADNLGIDITNNKLIKIRFKNTTASTVAQVYFITNASTTFDAVKHKDFTVTANSDYTEYTIDMSSVAGWTGTLKRLRFDPAIATGSFSIDYIKIGSTYLTPTPTLTVTPIPATTQAPSQNLKAYWDFENVTGTTVIDDALNDAVANNASLINGATIQTPGVQEGSSVFFDGTNDYATVADQAEIKKNGSFTVSAWINPSAVVTNRTQYILNKGTSATSFDYGFITTSTTGTATPTPPANVDANGKLVFRVGDLTPNKAIGPVLPINTWSLVTGVYDSAAGELRLYINGVLSAVEKVTGTVSMGTGALTFSAPSPNQFSGSLDEVRFYNRALAETEIQQLFPMVNGTPTTPTPIPPTPLPPTTTATITPTVTALPPVVQKWGTSNDGSITINAGETYNLNTTLPSKIAGRTCVDAVAYSVTSLGNTVAYLSTPPVAGCLNAGDEIMLINLQGTSASTYNTGVYEFLRVAYVSGNSVAFTTMKSRWYGDGFHSDANIGTDGGQQKVMLMRVPNYNNLTVSGTLTVSSWDGTKHGVLAFRVNGILAGTGTISADGKGFRGGTSQQYGEGYTGYLVDYGGGKKGGTAYADYVGYGGGGGYGTNGSKANLTNNDGAGGDAYGNAGLNPIYFGAGGGASGDEKQFNGSGLTPAPTPEPGPPGGAGGGIVFVMAQTINGFSGSIQSKGVSGSGRAGGGAGGSIRIEAGNVITSLSLNATGVSRGGKGRIAVYYETSTPSLTSDPIAYTSLLGQGPTPLPTPTSVNVTPTPIVWGTGADGDLVINSGITFNINSENSNTRTCIDGGDAVSYSVVSLTSSSAKLSVSPSNKCLKVGDEVLLINQRGNSTNYVNVGNFEYLRIGGIVGDTVYFTTGKTRFYGSGANNDSITGAGQSVSLIRVPNYQNVTINGTLTGNAWNGQYGVIAFRVRDTLTLASNAVITANTLGYRGGDGGAGSSRGESYPGDAIGFGGGLPGGAAVGDWNGYGGGGAHATDGGDGPGGNGGAGGTAYGISDLSMVFFGSGGGAGGTVKGQNGNPDQGGGRGGNGGGIILISGETLNFGGTISSIGVYGVDKGGTGAGGAIRIDGSYITLNVINVGAGTQNGAGGRGRIAIYYNNSLANSAAICAQASTYCKNTSQTSTPTPTPVVTVGPSTNPGTTGLVSWWTMNETSGTRFDSYGTNNLADNNTVGSAGGLKSNAADFELDNSEFLEIADNASLSTGNIDFTIGAWVKMETKPANYTMLASKYESASVGEYILTYTGANNGDRFYFQLFNASGTIICTAFANNLGAPVAGAWYYIVGWHDSVSRTCNIQINNGIPNSVNVTTGQTVADTNANFRVGAYITTEALFFDGLIDEVALYKRALTSAERTWLYNYGSGRTYTDINPTAPQGWIASTYAYEGDQPHAVTSLSGGNTYTYDDNGNMTCRVEDGVTYLQTYSAENRIASIQKLASGDCAAPGTLAAKWDFAYDGDGVRTSQLYTTYDENGQPQTAVVTRYYFGGALETSGTSVKKYYSFAGQMVAMKDDEGFKYFLSDHLGSVSLVLDDQGGILEGQRYLPFGEPRTMTPYAAVTSTDFTYTGQRALPDTGLMDYKARFYSPALKRFIQPDSIIPGAANPQSWNRYSYVYNNPVLHNDPDGHCPMCVTAAIGGILGAAIGAASVALPQMIQNVRDGQPLTTNIDPAEVGKAAAAGAVAGVIGGLTFGIGTAVMGTGLGATIAAGAISGAVAGQSSRATYNVLDGRNIGEGLFNPQDMAVDAVVGGALAGVGWGIGKYIKSFRGGCSFTKDTPVATKDGEKAIGAIITGDYVLAWNEADGTVDYYPVTAVLVHEDEVITELVIDGEWIETTPEHPFYTEEKGWVPAGELKTGMHVRQANGEYEVIWLKLDIHKVQEMYNLTVDTAHTFFVGDGEWLVHNTCSSTTLSRNLGGDVGDNMQAHHLIPCEYECHPFVQRAQQAGWNMDEAYNGALLPDNINLSKKLDLPVHNGYHPQYSQSVGRTLDNLNALATYKNWSNAKAFTQIKGLAGVLRAEIYNMGGGTWLR